MVTLYGLNRVAMDYTLPFYCMGQSTSFTNPMLRRCHTMKSPLMRCIDSTLPQCLDARPLLRHSDKICEP